MGTLKEKVAEVVAGYARKVFRGHSYFTKNNDDTVLSVVIVTDFKGHHTSGVSVLVRVQDELVIIEQDQNDKPVVDALLEAGIPREQIILAYTGEPMPEVIA